MACATRGELGEIAPGCGVAQSELGAVREAELRAATRELGVARVVLLGWGDSGMDGEPPPGSLAAADTVDVAAAVARVLADEQPTIVVSTDGLDGHRDHLAIGKATLQAVARSATPPERTYLWGLPRSLLGEVFSGAGTPDETITTVIDTSAHLEQRWRAIRKHATQVPPFDAMPPEMQVAFLTEDHLIRVHPAWNGGADRTRAVPGTLADLKLVSGNRAQSRRSCLTCSRRCRHVQNV